MKLLRLILVGALIEVVYLSFYVPLPGIPGVALFIIVNAAAFILFGVAIRMIRTSTTEVTRALVAVIIGFAVVFRLTFVPHDPVASDDIYRYVWDGRVALSGVNPFAFAPDDPKLAGLHTPDLPSKINFPHMRTLYPPLAQVFFYVSAAAFGDSVLGMKLLLMVFECSTMVLLVLILKRLRLSPGLVLVYAWCPVPVMYFGLDGHIDALAIPFLLLSLYLMLANRKVGGAVALGFAGLAKLYPMFIVPLLWRLESSWKRLVVVAVPVLMLTAGYLFYTEPTGGVFDSFMTFNSRFEFNGSMFTILYPLLRSNEATHVVCGVLFGLLLAVLAVIDRPILEKIFLAFLGFVVFSPIVHPWYLAWLTALVTLRWSVAVIVLLGISNLSNVVVYQYHTTGIWRDNPWVVLVEYFPFYILLIGEIVQGKFSSTSGFVSIHDRTGWPQ